MKKACIAAIRKLSTPWVLALLLGLFSIASVAQEVEMNENGSKLFKSKCTSCHAINKMVVGPALGGVNERRSEEWLISWIRNSQEMIKSGDPDAVALYEEYNKSQMTAFPELSDDDITDILAYIKYEETNTPVASNEGGDGGTAAMAEEKEPSIMLYLGIIIGLILLVNLFVRIKNNLKEAQDLPTPTLVNSAKEWLLANKIVIVLALLLMVVGGLKDTWDVLTTTGVHQDYQPSQPIAFSHKIHAGENAIDCNYCHSSARHSKTSGIPSANVCMNCHKYISEGKVTGTEEIAKIYAAVGFDPSKGRYIEGYQEKPIEWVRIHNLPDLAYFNHSQHVTAGNLECQECHGPIQEMEEVYQFSPLTMGWCINCHREKKIQPENGYYEGYYEDLVAKHNRDDIHPKDIGGLECGKCHY